MEIRNEYIYKTILLSEYNKKKSEAEERGNDFCTFESYVERKFVEATETNK